MLYLQEKDGDKQESRDRSWVGRYCRLLTFLEVEQNHRTTDYEKTELGYWRSTVLSERNAVTGVATMKAWPFGRACHSFHTWTDNEAMVWTRIQRVFVQKWNPRKWMKWSVGSYGHLHCSSLNGSSTCSCHVFSLVFCARVCPLHARAALAALTCSAWGGCTRAHCLVLRSRGRRRSRWERGFWQTLEHWSKALCVATCIILHPFHFFHAWTILLQIDLIAEILYWSFRINFARSRSRRWVWKPLLCFVARTAFAETSFVHVSSWARADTLRESEQSVAAERYREV